MNADLTTTQVVPDFDHPFRQETQAGIEAFNGWKTRLLDYATDQPADALFWMLTGGAFAFYVAEKDVNADVGSYNDALHYISTCLCVGYARIYPVTQTGKLIASIVMALGPSLSAWVIEGHLVRRTANEQALPDGGTPARDLTPMLERLDAILDELKAQRTGREA